MQKSILMWDYQAPTSMTVPNCIRRRPRLTTQEREREREREREAKQQSQSGAQVMAYSFYMACAGKYRRARACNIGRWSPAPSQHGMTWQSKEDKEHKFLHEPVPRLTLKTRLIFSSGSQKGLVCEHQEAMYIAKVSCRMSFQTLWFGFLVTWPPVSKIRETNYVWKALSENLCELFEVVMPEPRRGCSLNRGVGWEVAVYVVNMASIWGQCSQVQVSATFWGMQKGA